MILDTLSAFEPTSVAITATAPSSQTLDLKAARDLGVGDNDLKLIVISDGLFASATSAALLNAQFQGAPDSAGSPGSWTTYAETGTLTITQLNSGGGGSGDAVIFAIDVPARAVMGEAGQGTVLPHYYRINWAVSGGENFTAGHIVYAGFTLDAERPTSYPSGFTVAN